MKSSFSCPAVMFSSFLFACIILPSWHKWVMTETQVKHVILIVFASQEKNMIITEYVPDVVQVSYFKFKL